MKILTIIILLFTHALYANDEKENALLAGHTISFSSSYEKEIDNDLMVVNMQITHVDTDNQRVIDYINQNSKQVTQIVNEYYDISFKTSNYNIYPQYKNNKIKNWRGSYDFQLKTQNFNKLTTLLTKLQTYAHYQSVAFSVSKPLKDRIITEIQELSIKNHIKKAENIAASFGAKSYEFTITHIDSGDNSHLLRMPVAKSGVMFSESTAPRVSAGRSSVVLNINSTIALK